MDPHVILGPRMLPTRGNPSQKIGGRGIIRCSPEAAGEDRRGDRAVFENALSTRWTPTATTPTTTTTRTAMRTPILTPTPTAYPGSWISAHTCREGEGSLQVVQRAQGVHQPSTRSGLGCDPLQVVQRGEARTPVEAMRTVVRLHRF